MAVKVAVKSTGFGMPRLAGRPNGPPQRVGGGYAAKQTMRALGRRVPGTGPPQRKLGAAAQLFSGRPTRAATRPCLLRSARIRGELSDNY